MSAEGHGSADVGAQPPQPLDKLYAEAQQAIRAREHERAAQLLRQILIADENYRDASQLLARLVRVRRRRWYSDLRLLVPIGLLALVGVAVWVAPRLPKPIAPAPSTEPEPTAAIPTAVPTVAPPSAPTDTPVPEPTPIPLAWTRVSAGQEFSRDTVTAIAIDPTDPDVVYVGTETAGVYKSIDGGLSWSPIHNGLLRARIDSLYLDPSDPQVIHAGVRNGGVYRTSDGGQRWERLTQGLTDLDGDNPAVVDGSRSGGGQPYFSHGFYFYGLAYQAWSRLSESFTTTQFAVHPDDASRLIVIAAQDFDGHRPPRLFRSNDSGKSMELLGSPPELSWEDQLFYGAGAGDDDELYVLHQPAIYASTDGGSNWTANYGCYAATVDPQGDLVAACSTRLARTSNGGRTWTSLSLFPVETRSVKAIAISASDPNLIFLGGEGGLHASPDGGKTWQARNNGLGAGWLDLTVHPSAPSHLFVQEGNSYLRRRPEYPLHRSTDGGGRWDLLPISGWGLEIGADGQTLYRDLGGRSTDGGQTWLGWSPPGGCGSPGITAHPSQPGVAYAWGTEAICMTQDAGRTWEVIGSPRGPWSLFNAKLYFGAEQAHLYAVSNFGMSQSHNGGRYWSDCSSEESYHPLTEARMAVDPRDSDRLLLATLGEGVWISEDGCGTWQKAATGIRGQFVNAVVIDPRQPDVVYAGTDNGAYVSFDSGETWAPINDGLLGELVVYSAAIDAQGGVYAATPYGIFRLEAR